MNDLATTVENIRTREDFVGFLRDLASTSRRRVH
jgi:hypothetical protein